MSQHILSTIYKAQEIVVVTGWDRPMQGYFMFIQKVFEHRNGNQGEDVFLYSNLSDFQLAEVGGLSQSMEYFVKKLAEFNLQFPPVILKNVASDRCDNVGNRIVHYWYENSEVKSRVMM